VQSGKYKDINIIKLYMYPSNTNIFSYETKGHWFRIVNNPGVGYTRI